MKYYLLIFLLLLTLTVFFIRKRLKGSRANEITGPKTNKIKFNKMNVSEFKKFMLPSAMMIEKNFGIPHLFTLSQIALETAFGKSSLFSQFFNVGGIRSFKPESEPHGMYWTWEHVKPEELPKWDKYERDKSKDAPVIDKKTGKPNGKIKIRVKLPFRHFPDLVSGLAFWVNKVLMNRYFKHAAAEANGDPKKYASLLQAGKVKYATDTNYVPKVHQLIDQFKAAA